MIGQMGERESRELLRRCRTGRLGCVAEGEPYVVPVSYLTDGEFIYVHSLPGRKVEALRANPRACLQVDEIRDDYHWRSVIAFGSFEEITDEGERARLLELFFDAFPHFTPVESAMAQSSRLPQMIVFRIYLDRLTGVEEG